MKALRIHRAGGPEGFVFAEAGEPRPHGGVLAHTAEPISTVERDRTTSTAPARPGLLALLAFAQLIIALDYNIVYIALPDMASGLGFSDHSLQWVVSGYAVAFGGFLLLGGRACDLLRRRDIFIGGLGLYATASLLGGLAIAPWMLLSARAAQGLGGALLFPATLSLLNTTFAEGAARNRALSVWGAAGATGMIVGSLAGGVLTQAFGWRAVFFVNVPLATFAIVAALRLVDTSALQRTARRFDLPGALTATVGTTLAVLAIVQGPESGWTSPGVAIPAAAGTGLLAAFALIEYRSGEPLVPSRLLANRNLSTGTLVTFLFMATMGTVLYFLTVYFQATRGYSPLRTGIAFLIPMAATCLGSSAAGRVATRIGIRRTLLGSLALSAAGAALVGAAISPHSTYWALIPGFLIFGFGQGMTYTLMFAAATTGVAPHDQGVASGMASTTQQIGGAVGLAILIGIATAGTAGKTGAALTTATTDGIRTAIFVAAAGAVLAMLASLRFTRPPRQAGPPGDMPRSTGTEQDRRSSRPGVLIRLAHGRRRLHQVRGGRQPAVGDEVSHRFPPPSLDGTLGRKRDMKTMTCKQLGGPCELELRGDTADDVINLQDEHLKEMVAAGDQAHQPARDAMKGRWKRPISGMKWYKNTKREFAALPEG